MHPLKYKHVARKKGVYKGKPYYVIPVELTFADSYAANFLAVDPLATYRKARTWIVARSATEAANHFRDLFECCTETTVTAWGPQGGVVERYVGFETGIFAQMQREHTRARRPKQLSLFH